MRIDFDCSEFREIKTGHLQLGNIESDYSCNSLAFTHKGKPLPLVMGEIHFSRYENSLWEEELLKMKAGGINVIATYVFWVHHEEKRGEWNFTGNRDINKFLGLCKKHNLPVVLRIGPWCHGEVVRGGFPKYISLLPGKRTNNPKYLSYARILYRKIAEQVREYMDGNTLLGIQLENEYCGKIEHIYKLREIAIEEGFKTPIFTMTGWPIKERTPLILPLTGEYPEAPWTWHKRVLRKNAFKIESEREEKAAIGEDLIKDQGTVDKNGFDIYNFPFSGCEVGPGNHVTAHRRPIISERDGYGLGFCKTAEGMNLLGYYMYHGGSNPTGGLYQESKRTLYPNNYPVIDYDFQAPLSLFGYPRAHYHRLRLLHTFLHSFPEIAMMQEFFHGIKYEGELNYNVPRASVRVNEKGEGYFFVCTYERSVDVAEQKELQATVKLKDKTITLPTLDVPKGVFAFYPFNVDYSGVKLDYITASPITCITRKNEKNYYFVECDGIPARMSIDGKEQIITARDKVGYTTVIDGVSVNFTVLTVAKAKTFYAMDNKAIFTEAVIYKDDELNVMFKDGDYLNIDGKNVTLAAGAPAPKITIAECGKKPAMHKHYLFSFGKKKYYTINVDKNALDGMQDVLLQFDFKGNSLQLYSNGLLINDFFNIDNKYELSLRYIREYVERGEELYFVVAPLDSLRKIYFETDVKVGECELKLKNVIPYYKTKVKL